MLTNAFKVESAEPDKVGTHLNIMGVEAVFKTNILRNLSSNENIIPLSLLGFPQSDNYILNKTRSALQALGYYQPILTLTDDKEGKILTIDLQSPVRWNNTSIVLNCEIEVAEMSTLVVKHPFTKGKVINHGDYSQFKSTLQRQAQELGLLNASFSTSLLNVDVAQLQANVKWVFNCGARYTINKITIEGTVLSHDLINSYSTIRSGDAYNQLDIIASQQALNRSGFFKSVVVDQSVNHVTKTVDVSLSILDTDKYELKTLLGFGTDSGGKLGVSWRNRRVNSKAHQYVASVDFNKVKLDIADIHATFQYQIPLAKASSQWINLVSYQIKNEEIGRSKILTFESVLANKIDPNWSSQWSIAMAKEQLESEADVNRSLEYIVPSWQLNYYSVTDPFSAIEGWRWQSTIRFSTEQLSNPDIKFIQTDQKVKRIWSLNGDWRLLLRARVGTTWMDTDDFNSSMPSNYRFFAGGDVSVRGYKHQSLSPIDNEVPIGGKHILSTGLEVDYLFYESFRWALFTDQGNAFNDWKDWELQKSVGTGLRWVTPIGAIRLDIAKALDGNKAWRFHVTIGPDL
ncbi:BamA/TamA family outer membrane protein [Colwellia sp. BRX10-3]|uniref:autotransporter assembly complex protein TamA n=1 Tax=Colwellia sp. BRX10-3 TaxID=2759844 RepID=UPI0015F77F53|nr:BamA/TamA family outer membrane protein [Colwellia sp. BRX10-3]MBA6391329.1 BamA/TamA family outer membrane protein [Colwellia sp. BRX10-3]